MARIDTTPATILQRVLARLRDQLSLDANQCYLSTTPDAPVIPRGGDYFCVVSAGGGRFFEDEQAAGNCTEASLFVVTIYSRVALDRTDEDEEMLLEASRGVFAVKRLVLKALVGHDLADGEDDTLLRHWVFARTATAPELLQQAKSPKALLGTCQIEFGAMFDWDLVS